jgi:hypothetical protein
MIRLRTCSILLSFLGLVLIPAIAGADCLTPTRYTRFALDDASSLDVDCQIQVNGVFGFVNVILVTDPVSKVRFTLPDPPAGVTVLSETWYFPYTGDRHSGMEMDLGCSASGNVAIGQFAVLLPNPSQVQCGEWRIGDGCEVEDCNGNPQPSYPIHTRFGFSCGGSDCFQDCGGRAPYNLYPPHGATGVPVNATLSWQNAYPYYYGQTGQCSVRIGTTPDCSDAQVVNFSCTADPGVVLDFLQPSTTYYWQASYYYPADSCVNTDGASTIYSFTTAGPVATQASTWGRVKAMYRE